MEAAIAKVSRKLLLGALAALLLSAVVALPGLRGLLWSWESNSILRGRLVAERSGCFNCHLALSRAEIPNPGSRWGTVPRFGEGNAMMYVGDAREVEEFIRFGAPRSWLDDESVSDRLESQHLRMPAYEDRLTEAEIDDLVAYVAAVERIEPAGDEASAGAKLAREHGCLACHGIAGSGGLPNPGSLGGFIPGFLGGNFEDLVASEEEFEEWVLDGTSSRLAANPLLRYFWQRQEISMPAYRDQLTPEDVESLWKWVSAIRADT